jgi:hypothetical protein
MLEKTFSFSKIFVLGAATMTGLAGEGKLEAASATKTRAQLTEGTTHRVGLREP